MDEVEVHDRSGALLHRLEDRIPPHDFEQIREFHDGGELDELVDNLAALLSQDQIPISTEERDELTAILNAFSIPMEGMRYINDRDNVLASLNVT